MLSLCPKKQRRVPFRLDEPRFAHVMDKTTAVPFPSSEERQTAVLEFQKAAARLVRAGCITADDSIRMVRFVNRTGRVAVEQRDSLRDLVLTVLLSVEDGTLREGAEFLWIPKGLAIHVESTARALFRARRSSRGTRDLQRLFRFGARRFSDIVLARSERAMFGGGQDRRRAVVLDIDRAWEFVGGRPLRVPIR